MRVLPCVTQVQNISAIADICILGHNSSSLMLAADYVGFDLTAFVDETMNLIRPFNASQFGNITVDIELARFETTEAWVSVLMPTWSPWLVD